MLAARARGLSTGVIEAFTAGCDAAFASIPSHEMSSVTGGVATASALSDAKLRPLLHLTREISQLGQQQQQSQNQATQTMMMAAVMSRMMR